MGYVFCFAPKTRTHTYSCGKLVLHPLYFQVPGPSQPSLFKISRGATTWHFTPIIRRDIFYLLYYVTRQSEKLRLKNGFCLTSLQNCLFLVSSEFSEKIIILKHYSALLNYTKIKINMHIFWFLNFFFCDPDLKNFS